MNFLYPVPVTSIVTQTFAEHVHAARVSGWKNYNGGIDWAVPLGTPVRAAQSGKVVLVRFDLDGYGVHVRIQHDDGYLTIYAHLDRSAVKAGDQVSAGQVIGYSGTSGNSTGPHLHYELRKNGMPVDPQPLLYAAPVVEPVPVLVEPGACATIRGGWNLRQAPGTSSVILAEARTSIPCEVMSTDGEWVRVQAEVWVHQEALK